MKKVLVFFGIPGSGKSFIAKSLSEEFNLPFYETGEDYSVDQSIEPYI